MVNSTRKSGRKSTRKSTRKVASKTKKRMSKNVKKSIMLKNKDLKLYVGSKLQTSKHSWVSISDNMIYISRDNNRIYWVLSKLKKFEIIIRYTKS